MVRPVGSNGPPSFPRPAPPPNPPPIRNMWISQADHERVVTEWKEKVEALEGFIRELQERDG